MELSSRQKKVFLFSGVGVILLLIIIAIIVNITRTTNQFGPFITIQNYAEFIPEGPEEIKDSTETTLYRVAELNQQGDSSLTNVPDAFIREDSYTFDSDTPDNTTFGSYIVDIESLGQSYFVQYEYLNTEEGTRRLGNTVSISCLSENQLRFGEFECVDFDVEQAEGVDPLISFLPYENFSFRLRADATISSDPLLLLAELRIPTQDLSGDLASRQEVVALYKNEVRLWIESNNQNPDDYVIEYDYNDNGDFIGIAPPVN